MRWTKGSMVARDRIHAKDKGAVRPATTAVRARIHAKGRADAKPQKTPVREKTAAPQAERSSAPSILQHFIEVHIEYSGSRLFVDRYGTSSRIFLQSHD
jgi:hypothetical protein